MKVQHSGSKSNEEVSEQESDLDWGGWATECERLGWLFLTQTVPSNHLTVVASQTSQLPPLAMPCRFASSIKAM